MQLIICSINGVKVQNKKIQNKLKLWKNLKLYDIKYTRKIDEEVMKMDSAIKSIIDRMWNNFWEGGVTNPLTVIEQITYLLFIKGLDDIENSWGRCISIYKVIK